MKTRSWIDARMTIEFDLEHFRGACPSGKSVLSRELPQMDWRE